MQIDYSIIYIIFVPFCVESCSTINKSDSSWSTNYNDSVIICHWDTILAKKLRKTKKAYVYCLHALSVVDSSQTSIMGYSINDKQKISHCKLEVSRFMLSNDKFYNDDKITWKTLFSPYLAISIEDSSDHMYSLINYNTPEWALVKNGVIIRRIYTRTDMLVQYSLDIFPDDKYLISVFDLNK